VIYFSQHLISQGNAGTVNTVWSWSCSVCATNDMLSVSMIMYSTVCHRVFQLGLLMLSIYVNRDAAYFGLAQWFRRSSNYRGVVLEECSSFCLRSQRPWLYVCVFYFFMTIPICYTPTYYVLLRRIHVHVSQTKSIPRRSAGDQLVFHLFLYFACWYHTVYTRLW